MFKETSLIQNLLLAALLMAACSIAQAEFYRWVDDDGTIHYSDSLPPNKAQREQDKLNAHGRITESIPAPKTLGELEEERRIAKLKEQELRAKEKEEHRDRVLLAMYLSVEDIESVRDERLSTVQSAIEITNLRKRKFIEKLEDIDRSEQKFKTNGQKLPPAIVKSRKHYQEQLSHVREILHIKEKEKLAIKQRFSGDINRYLQLTQPDLASQ